MRKITKGISLLIDKDKSTIQNEDFFSHNVQRKNYIFYYQKNILRNLLDQKKIYSSIKSSNVKVITDAWMKRWLIKRIKRVETLDKLKLLGPYSVQKNLRPDEKVSNVVNLFK